jgi:predicted amidophosphoribosyltransferase
VAHIRKVQRHQVLWALVQIAGICLLFAYPVGTIAGVVILSAGLYFSAAPVCSNCGRRVQRSASTCPHCGHAFVDVAQMKSCPHCTGEMSAEATKCRHCGEPLSE